MRISSLRSLAFATLASGLLLTTGCQRDADASPDDITTAEAAARTISKRPLAPTP